MQPAKPPKIDPVSPQVTQSTTIKSNQMINTSIPFHVIPLLFLAAITTITLHILAFSITTILLFFLFIVVLSQQ